MKALKGFIPFALALILATVVVIYALKDDKDDPQPVKPHYEQYERQLDSLRQKYDSTQQQRDSLFRVVDSLHLSIQTRNILIDSLNKELSLIPGRYDSVPVDSLGVIMDERAATHGNQ